MAIWISYSPMAQLLVVRAGAHRLLMSGTYSRANRAAAFAAANGGSVRRRIIIGTRFERLMPFVPGAEFDVFISYSWADNQSGWVDRFEKALTERVHVLLGQKPDFFRDLRELSGEKDFTLEIQTRLEKSAALVAVLSPGYFQSDYCRMERTHYVEHVEGGLAIGTRVKLIKAIKLPHPKGLHRSFVKQAIGFPFHTDPPEIVEYLPGEANFSEGIDKLAKGLKHLLDDIANSKAKIYVAEPVPPALTAIWQRLRNQLGKKGFQLLPADRLDTFIEPDYIANEMKDAALTVSACPRPLPVQPPADTARAATRQTHAPLGAARPTTVASRS